MNGEPPSNKPKLHSTNFFKQTKGSFTRKINSIVAGAGTSSTSPPEQLDDKALDQIFLNLPEYPDGPSAASSSKKVSKSKKETKPKDFKGLSIEYEPPLPTTEKNYSGLQFQEDCKGYTHVYTDGSCESNGKFAAAAGLGVYFGERHPLNVSEPVTGRPTNNAGEIQASIRAIRDSQSCGIKRLKVYTDSQFLINSVCKWMKGWKKKNWKLANGKKVVNVKDFLELDELIESGNMVIQWCYIPAHKGHHGNEEADRLAKIGASMYRTKREKQEDDGEDSDYDCF